MRNPALFAASGLAVVLALTLAVPALGGPSILKRVKKLERRMNATATLAVRANRRQLARNVWSEPMTYNGNGVFAGQVSCGLPGDVATGGGVSSLGQRYTTDNILQSYPNLDGWYAEVHTDAPSPSLKVYVVCTRIGY